MYVISGANGHVGEVAAHELLKAGQKVRVIVHASNKRGRWESEGAEVVVGSVDDADFLNSTSALHFHMHWQPVSLPFLLPGIPPYPLY